MKFVGGGNTPPIHLSAAILLLLTAAPASATATSSIKVICHDSISGINIQFSYTDSNNAGLVMECSTSGMSVWGGTLQTPATIPGGSRVLDFPIADTPQSSFTWEVALISPAPYPAMFVGSLCDSDTNTECSWETPAIPNPTGHFDFEVVLMPFEEIFTCGSHEFGMAVKFSFVLEVIPPSGGPADDVTVVCTPDNDLRLLVASVPSTTGSDALDTSPGGPSVKVKFGMSSGVSLKPAGGPPSPYTSVKLESSIGELSEDPPTSGPVFRREHIITRGGTLAVVCDRHSIVDPYEVTISQTVGGASVAVIVCDKTNGASSTSGIATVDTHHKWVMHLAIAPGLFDIETNDAEVHIDGWSCGGTRGTLFKECTGVALVPGDQIETLGSRRIRCDDLLPTDFRWRVKTQGPSNSQSGTGGSGGGSWTTDNCVELKDTIVGATLRHRIGLESSGPTFFELSGFDAIIPEDEPHEFRWKPNANDKETFHSLMCDVNQPTPTCTEGCSSPKFNECTIVEDLVRLVQVLKPGTFVVWGGGTKGGAKVALTHSTASLNNVATENIWLTDAIDGLHWQGLSGQVASRGGAARVPIPNGKKVITLSVPQSAGGAEVSLDDPLKGGTGLCSTTTPSCTASLQAGNPHERRVVFRVTFRSTLTVECKDDGSDDTGTQVRGYTAKVKRETTGQQMEFRCFRNGNVVLLPFGPSTLSNKAGVQINQNFVRMYASNNKGTLSLFGDTGARLDAFDIPNTPLTNCRDSKQLGVPPPSGVCQGMSVGDSVVLEIAYTATRIVCGTGAATTVHLVVGDPPVGTLSLDCDMDKRSGGGVSAYTRDGNEIVLLANDHNGGTIKYGDDHQHIFVPVQPSFSPLNCPGVSSTIECDNTAWDEWFVMVISPDASPPGNIHIECAVFGIVVQTIRLTYSSNTAQMSCIGGAAGTLSSPFSASPLPGFHAQLTLDDNSDPSVTVEMLTSGGAVDSFNPPASPPCSGATPCTFSTPSGSLIQTFRVTSRKLVVDCGCALTDLHLKIIGDISDTPTTAWYNCDGPNFVEIDLTPFDDDEDIILQWVVDDQSHTPAVGIVFAPSPGQDPDHDYEPDAEACFGFGGCSISPLYAPRLGSTCVRKFLCDDGASGIYWFALQPAGPTVPGTLLAPAFVKCDPINSPLLDIPAGTPSWLKIEGDELIVLLDPANWDTILFSNLNPPVNTLRAVIDDVDPSSTEFEDGCPTSSGACAGPLKDEGWKTTVSVGDPGGDTLIRCEKDDHPYTMKLLAKEITGASVFVDVECDAITGQATIKNPSTAGPIDGDLAFVLFAADAEQRTVVVTSEVHEDRDFDNTVGIEVVVYGAAGVLISELSASATPGVPDSTPAVRCDQTLDTTPRTGLGGSNGAGTSNAIVGTATSPCVVGYIGWYDVGAELYSVECSLFVRAATGGGAVLQSSLTGPQPATFAWDIQLLPELIGSVTCDVSDSSASSPDLLTSGVGADVRIENPGGGSGGRVLIEVASVDFTSDSIQIDAKAGSLIDVEREDIFTFPFVSSSSKVCGSPCDHGLLSPSATFSRGRAGEVVSVRNASIASSHSAGGRLVVLRKLPPPPTDPGTGPTDPDPTGGGATPGQLLSGADGLPDLRLGGAGGSGRNRALSDEELALALALWNAAVELCRAAAEDGIESGLQNGREPNEADALELLIQIFVGKGIGFYFPGDGCGQDAASRECVRCLLGLSNDPDGSGRADFAVGCEGICSGTPAARRHAIASAAGRNVSSVARRRGSRVAAVRQDGAAAALNVGGVPAAATVICRAALFADQVACLRRAACAGLVPTSAQIENIDDNGNGLVRPKGCWLLGGRARVCPNCGDQVEFADDDDSWWKSHRYFMVISLGVSGILCLIGCCSILLTAPLLFGWWRRRKGAGGFFVGTMLLPTACAGGVAIGPTVCGNRFERLGSIDDNCGGSFITPGCGMDVCNADVVHVRSGGVAMAGVSGAPKSVGSLDGRQGASFDGANSGVFWGPVGASAAAAQMIPAVTPGGGGPDNRPLSRQVSFDSTRGLLAGAASSGRATPTPSVVGVGPPTSDGPLGRSGFL